jgi:hypothetical protein
VSTSEITWNSRSVSHFHQADSLSVPAGRVIPKLWQDGFRCPNLSHGHNADTFSAKSGRSADDRGVVTNCGRQREE